MEAQEYLASCSCPEYLRKAERRLAEEVERCVNYLDPTSEPKITAVVEQELIRKQARRLAIIESFAANSVFVPRQHFRRI